MHVVGLQVTSLKKNFDVIRLTETVLTFHLLNQRRTVKD